MRLTFLILLVSWISLSCQREPAKNNDNSTSASAIERAQDKSLSKLNPYTIKPGQWVYFIETQEVISSQGSSAFLSKEWTTEVGEVEKSETGTMLTIFKKVTDHLTDKDFVYEFKNVLSLAPEVVSHTIDPLNDQYQTMEKTLQRLKEKNEGTPEIEGVSYQNLQVKRVSISPPKMVKDLPDCGNIPNCNIEGDLITYDIVFLFEDESTQRHSIEWLISEEVPFFAGLLKQCSTSFVPIDDLRVLVKQCREVVDFKE